MTAQPAVPQTMDTQQLAKHKIESIMQTINPKVAGNG